MQVLVGASCKNKHTKKPAIKQRLYWGTKVIVVTLCARGERPAITHFLNCAVLNKGAYLLFSFKNVDNTVEMRVSQMIPDSSRAARDFKPLTYTRIPDAANPTAMLKGSAFLSRCTKVANINFFRSLAASCLSLYSAIAASLSNFSSVGVNFIIGHLS